MSTTVDADVDLHWQVTALFNDANRNGVWDQIGTGTIQPEITQTQVSMRLLNESSETVTAVISNAWRFTEPLRPGSYTFLAEKEAPAGQDWVYFYGLEIHGAVDPLYAPADPVIGLLPRQELYLPLLVNPFPWPEGAIP